VHGLSGLTATGLRDAAADAAADATASGPGLLVVHPDRAPSSALAPLLEHEGRNGFVVVDMSDLDSFGPVDQAKLPDGPLYVVEGLDRGDSMANWSPAEALPAITAAGRTPLTVGEGIQWLMHRPDILQRNHCFMTIGSRLRKPGGAMDARTPAIWISNGTGRDGRPRRDAPKVGWCWAGNRHTWLGFASATARTALR
jgi:hypothetical protein